ncbi:MAG: site-specific integrase [Alphaproteobacteria bacterium]|nr:site-specific integrase [Alphaproteobacteria bacterium]
MPKITKKFVDTLKPKSGDTIHWDSDISRFGVRVRGESMSYILQYRNHEGRTKRLTLGKTTVLTPEQARKLAQDKNADIQKGLDPSYAKQEQRKALNISELCELYLDEGISHKRLSTIRNDKLRISRHIIPLIGSCSVKSLDRATIEKMMLNIVKGKIPVEASKRPLGGNTAATRSVTLLGAILEFARRRGIITMNPAHGIKKPKDNKRDVFLTLEELEVFGKALKQAEKHGEDKSALKAIRLLALTGCRKTEILSLEWSFVDLKEKCFRFADTKTGKQTRPFGQGALDVLHDLQHSGKWVFPSGKTDSYFINLTKVFHRVLAIAHTLSPEIKDKRISLHTLRHTFASTAAQMGYSELTIAGLLGHRLGGVTNRYSHLPDKSLIMAADSISSAIADVLARKK